jgi:hypothetical protein
VEPELQLVTLHARDHIVELDGCRPMRTRGGGCAGKLVEAIRPLSESLIGPFLARA